MTQKKQILIIHFNFKKEIYLKMNDTKKNYSNNPIKFYVRTPIKDERHKTASILQKKSL